MYRHIGVFPFIIMFILTFHHQHAGSLRGGLGASSRQSRRSSLNSPLPGPPSPRATLTYRPSPIRYGVHVADCRCKLLTHSYIHAAEIFRRPMARFGRISVLLACRRSLYRPLPHHPGPYSTVYARYYH